VVSSITNTNHRHTWTCNANCSLLYIKNKEVKKKLFIFETKFVNLKPLWHPYKSLDHNINKKLTTQFIKLVSFK
jgi:hypothetical protein